MVLLCDYQTSSLEKSSRRYTASRAHTLFLRAPSARSYTAGCYSGHSNYQSTSNTTPPRARGRVLRRMC